MAEPGFEGPPSPSKEAPVDNLACGLDRLMRDVDGKPATNGFGSGGGSGSGNLQAVTAESRSPGSVAAATAAKFAETFPGQSTAPAAATTPAATTVHSPAVPSLAEASGGALAPPAPTPYQPEARGSLIVKDAVEIARSPSPPAPVVRLGTSKSPPPPRVRRGGGKKLGARKMGATKLGSGSGVVKLADFEEPVVALGVGTAAPSVVGVGTGQIGDLELARKLQEEEDAAAEAATVAPSSRLAAAASAALATPYPSSGKTSAAAAAGGAGGGGSLYRSTNDSPSFGGGNGYRNGGGSVATSSGSGLGVGSYGNGGGGSSYGGGGGGGGSFDKDKYKNVKGIGSDMLFGARDDDPEEQNRRAMKVQEYSQSAAISSDMYFDREEPGGGGGGGYDGANGGVGIGDMAEQIAISAAAEFQGAAEAASKLKVRFFFFGCDCVSCSGYVFVCVCVFGGVSLFVCLVSFGCASMPCGCAWGLE